jgi:predicted metal-dependent peptidase
MSGLVAQLKDGAVAPSDAVLKHVARAKIRLQMSDPFTAAMLIQMPVVYTDTLPTMATDGTALYINPDFALTLSGAEIQGVFTHEVMHKIFFHHLRRGTRCPDTWNVAGDVIINDLLRKDGKTLPASALDWQAVGELKRDRSEYSTEILADELSQKDPPQPGGGGEGDDQGDDQDQDQGQGQDPFADEGGTGIVIDAENDSGEALDAAQISEQEREIAADVQNAAQIAKAQGKLPARMAEYVDDLRDAKIDWTEQFARFLGKGSDHRYDWNRTDKKLQQRGLIGPRRVREGVGHIVIAVDTSASVSQQEYKALMAEAKSVCQDVDAEQVTVIYCDTRIAHVDTYDDPASIEEKDLGRYGGGGTDFQPPFDYVYENDLDVDSFVYLTDLECSMPDEPDYPVLWVSTTSAVADFGTTIHLN